MVWIKTLTHYSNNYSNYVANYQVYFNNTIFYALNDASSTSDLALYQSSITTLQPNLYNHYLYPYCPTITLDAYNSYLVVNCGSYAQVRNANYPYDPIINITYANYTY